MAAKRLDLKIRQGETFQRVIRWEVPPYIYKPITAITNAAPVVITAPLHGLTNGWRVAAVSVGGMVELNAVHSPPRDSDYDAVTVIDVNNVALNDVNSASYGVYTTGGYLQFYTPQDLTGFSARLEIKDFIGGTILLSCTSGAPDNRFVIDTTNRTITLTIAANDTALMAFTRGVYDLEMVSGGGVVTTLYSGNVTVTKEVTT